MFGVSIHVPTYVPFAGNIAKRIPNKKATINTIRDILTREARNCKDLPTISCYTARDRNTLIIHSVNNSETQKLYQFINTVTSLKGLVVIIHRLTSIKNIIVLGIPLSIKQEEVTEKIQPGCNYYAVIPISIWKEFKDTTRKCINCHTNGSKRGKLSS